MCDGCAPAPGWSRRRALGLLGAGLVGAGVAVGPSVAPAHASAAEGIRARNEWAGWAHPAGSLVAEPDVRVLVVHHTANGNDYSPEHVPAMLRAIHRFHTGPERGWPDIAYNFVVDRFGGIWETRGSSLHGPVAGDATGGNQGHDQKAAFLGDLRHQAPTTAAIEAMVRLLALLADRHGIDTTPGAMASFVSRGSNRHPPGSVVTVPTICGHRMVSATECPGAVGDSLVVGHLPGAVSALRSGGSAGLVPPAAPGPAQAEPPPAPGRPPGDPAPSRPAPSQSAPENPVASASPPPDSSTTTSSGPPATAPAVTSPTTSPRGRAPFGPLEVAGDATPARAPGSGTAGTRGLGPIRWVEGVAGAVVLGAGLVVTFRNRTSR